MNLSRSQLTGRSAWTASMMMTVACGVAWMISGTAVMTSARMTLHGLLSPGRLAVLAFTHDAFRKDSETDSTSSQNNSTELPSELTELQNALLQNELQRRQLLIQNARLHNDLRSAKRLQPAAAVVGEDLLNYRCVVAKILSHNGFSNTLSEAVIDAGRSQGLTRSQLVVEGTGLLLDKGDDFQIAQGQKVVQGAAVVGRIQQVSAWVSLVQPVTDSGFSAAVQIVRLGQQGAAFGATGLLEGTGTECRITGIPYTASVSTGDEVFSAEINGVSGPRLYYGRIRKAQFSAGGEWDLLLEPAFDADQLTEVAVVQQQLNSRRTEQPRRTSPTTAGERQ